MIGFKKMIDNHLNILTTKLHKKTATGVVLNISYTPLKIKDTYIYQYNK